MTGSILTNSREKSKILFPENALKTRRSLKKARCLFWLVSRQKIEIMAAPMIAFVRIKRFVLGIVTLK